MNQPLQFVTVKALIVRQGKILFARDTKGVWEFPGGRINLFENPEEALRRELAEELNVLKNIAIKGILDAWSFVSVDHQRQFIVLVYECIIPEVTLELSHEHTKLAWVPVGEVETLNIRDGYKMAVKKYLHAT